MERQFAELPNRYDFAESQPRLYRWWEERGYFHSDPDPQRTPFTIVIPPPNVTGALHLGHALNNTLQDILIRMKRMQGFNTLWMPGTDHAGIATQAVVEKRLLEEQGKTRHDLGREKLVELIWQWKDQYEARILSQLKQMGCSCDWRRTRFTLDPICARAVRQTFFNMFREGLIYRGKRLVNWDTLLQTAVSDDEVFHETVQGHFWHIRYPVIDPRPGEPEFVEIATTRPETLLGDTAVAVHPDPQRALEEAEQQIRKKLADAPAKERAELEKELEEIVRRRDSVLPQLLQLRDMARDGRQLLLPLLRRPIPLICDTWAKPEMGSGAVKITPAHDPNDYDVWQRHPEIGAINILNPDGTLNENAGPYRGLSIAEARRRVVADLEAEGLLVRVEDRLIDLAHSDRSKTPIEPYLADQWFVKMDRLAQSAMDAVLDGRVKIVPPRYAKTYLDWLAEKRDWPVGRQLWWGHQIPIWRKPWSEADERWLQEAFQLQPLPSGVRAAGDQLAVQKLDATDERPAELLVCVAPDHEQLEQQLEAHGFRQEEEVLDTWFSSALWPHSTLGWPEQTPELKYYYPTDVLVTSRDIITLWVARMVLTGLFNVGQVPFREVYIHPKILDGYGETMSKSKGNGVDPIDVIDKFGADALRFGLAYLTTETQDVRMPVQFECPHCGALIDQTHENRQLPRVPCDKCGKAFSTQWATKDEDRALPRGLVVSERFEMSRNFVNKLWNAARFSLMNLEGFSPGPVDDAQLEIEDRWILSRLTTVTERVDQALRAYHFAEATRVLYDFAWDEFCSFYIEMAKQRLADESKRTVAARVLAHTLDTLLRLLHPTIPFVTEEVWQLLGQVAPQRGLPQPQPAAESIMIAPWPVAHQAWQDAEIESQFARFQQVLGALREIRSRQNIPPRTSVSFCVRCDDESARLLQRMAGYFERLAQATAADLGPAVEPPAGAATIVRGDLEIYVDLTGCIDVEAEIRRNEKERQKLQQLIAGKEKKLENRQFVERAPAEVVQQEQQRLAQLRQQLALVEATLEQLQRQ